MSLRVTPTELAALQRSTERIRNICILAHVDHGKTTLSDSLVSANGIISEKLAGKIRYLDNTEEEQTRGITMKSSAISLLFRPEPNPATAALATEATEAAAEPDEPYLINLVDSPGHVDFSFDVSTAVRLCDGALVLIDAVEGVCAQTIAVIRQAWHEGIRPCLVINKMDRLIFELQLSPFEACQRLNRILEQANAVLSSLIRAEVLAKHEAEDDHDDATASIEDDKKDDDDMNVAMANETAAMERELLFSPVNGNVLFASAVDGWAFNIGFFAHLYTAKLELPFRVVRQALWGDHYYNAKTKKIVTKPPTSQSQTMFCNFILEPIWNVYNALNTPVTTEAEFEAARKLTRQLRVARLVPDRDLKHTERKVAIQAVMRKWLPLANTVLKMVTRALPNPIVAQQKRAERLCGLGPAEALMPSPTRDVFSSLQRCETTEETSPVVIFVCKMISVEANVLSDFHQRGLAADEEVYVAMGRVYSGTIRAGQPVYILDPKFQGYHGADPETLGDLSKIKHVSRLAPGVLRPYMMMGRELHAQEAVPAGNIVGLVGLQEQVLKTATLSSTLACPSLTRMPYQAKPIVRVAVEPEDPRNFAALEAGLQRLYRSDPTVEVQVQETGEHVIVALGELHLERCIKDLKDRFAKVAVRVSEPLVGFRESLVDNATPSPQQSVVFRDLLATSSLPPSSSSSTPSTMTPNGATVESPHVALGTTPDGSLTLKIRALPLPDGVAKFLEEHVDAVRLAAERSKHNADAPRVDSAVQDIAAANDATIDAPVDGLEAEDPVDEAASDDADEVSPEATATMSVETLAKDLEARLRASSEPFWKTLPVSRLWCFGPRRVRPNVLINSIPGYTVRSGLFHDSNTTSTTTAGPALEDEHVETLRKLESSILTGFQMATSAGPLCDEPVWGVAFVVEDVVFHTAASDERDGNATTTTENNTTTTTNESFKFGPLSGQIISTMRTACRVAFVKQPVRLVEAVYECTVQCLAEQLGKLYSVIAKRRGDVFSEELSDGSALFTIKAHLPVVESFGFATDLLIQTSGAASNPQLVFSHWMLMDMDPFFQPQTEDEREDFGERVYEHNYVRKYIEAVRKRKGLARDEKIVVHAEKQRTLARKR